MNQAFRNLAEESRQKRTKILESLDPKSDSTQKGIPEDGAQSTQVKGKAKQADLGHLAVFFSVTK
jgi:hypothetical protein